MQELWEKTEKVLDSSPTRTETGCFGPTSEKALRVEKLEDSLGLGSKVCRTYINARRANGQPAKDPYAPIVPGMVIRRDGVANAV